MHTVLSSGATEVLWWRPGSQRPEDLGYDLLSAVLKEIDLATFTAAGSVPSADCYRGLFSPTVDLERTTIRGQDDAYLLSGVRVSCPGEHVDRRVYRLTPRRLDCPYCATRPAPSALAAGDLATLRLIGGGQAVTPVPDGCWWQPAGNTSSSGYWIAAPCR